MSDYNKFTTMLASEFHRYLMENEEMATSFSDSGYDVDSGDSVLI